MMEYVTAHVIIRFHKGTSSVVFDGFFGVHPNRPSFTFNISFI